LLQYTVAMSFMAVCKYRGTVVQSFRVLFRKLVSFFASIYVCVCGGGGYMCIYIHTSKKLISYIYIYIFTCEKLISYYIYILAKKLFHIYVYIYIYTHTHTLALARNWFYIYIYISFCEKTVFIYIWNQSRTTLVFINLFSATCFGPNCEPYCTSLRTPVPP